MSKLVVVGSLNMDLVVRSPHLPRPGETILGRDFMTAPGGKGANQTVAAAKLGATVHMVGRVGGDNFGQALRANLRAANADDSCVSTENSAATGIAIIEVEDSGQNTIVVAPGANAHVARADVDAARSIIVSSQALIAQLEIPLDTVWYALLVAREACARKSCQRKKGACGRIEVTDNHPTGGSPNGRYHRIDPSLSATSGDGGETVAQPCSRSTGNQASGVDRNGVA